MKLDAQQMKIAQLEHDADAARFTWYEQRETSNGPVLWLAFTLAAQALTDALAAMRPHKS